MERQHRGVLRVVLEEDASRFNGRPEPPAYVGKTGVGGVAIDVGLYPACSDEHIPIAACRTAFCDEVRLPLADHFGDGRNGLAAGCKTTGRDMVACVNEFCNGVRKRINLIQTIPSVEVDSVLSSQMKVIDVSGARSGLAARVGCRRFYLQFIQRKSGSQFVAGHIVGYAKKTVRKIKSGEAAPAERVLSNRMILFAF
jgi:hypothetical protein